ncbi:MAG TPA: MFS transporter [Terriglobia bacterium]|nr:MFS transporter [Terriglobia bacterium]
MADSRPRTDTLAPDDPREILSKSPMSPMQVLVIAVTVALNALDGFDALAISFASPGIAKEWGIDRGALGFVLAAELVGMSIGSLFLGGIADKLGRRRTVLSCIGVMTVGMFMCTTPTNPTTLSIWRVITGLGIGGMLAVTNAVAAEFANLKRRDLCVSIMSIGYPIGAVVGGMITAQLLLVYDWRSVFYLGAITSLILLPLVYFFVPESVHWLMHKRPTRALDQINQTLRRMGHAVVNSLPAVSPEARKQTVGDIFKPGLIRTTMLVSFTYLFHITTFYFLIKWVPKIVVDFGFAPASAAGVLVWTNVGGALGGALLGLLTQRFNLRGLTIGAMFLSTIAVTIFGRTPHDLTMLSIVCAISGFFVNAAIVGQYAIFAKAFPTHVRAFGTGFAVGIGRGASFLAPILAGYLFEAGYELPSVSLTMALGATLAAGTLLMLRLGTDKTATGQTEPAKLKRAEA